MAPNLAPLHFDCSRCGARISTSGSSRTVVCSYCTTEMVLPDAIWNELHPAPARAAAPSGAPGKSLLFLLLVVGLPLVGTCTAALA